MQRLVSGNYCFNFIVYTHMQRLIAEITTVLHAIADLTHPLEEALVSGKLCFTFTVCTHLYNSTGTTDIMLLDIIGESSFEVVHRAIWRGSMVAAKVIALPSSADMKSVTQEFRVWQ